MAIPVRICGMSAIWRIIGIAVTITVLLFVLLPQSLVSGTVIPVVIWVLKTSTLLGNNNRKRKL